MRIGEQVAIVIDEKVVSADRFVEPIRGSHLSVRPLLRRSVLLICWVALGGCNLVLWNHDQVLRAYERAGFKAHQVELRSGSMHYYDGGSGPPIVFVHGFAFGALETWEHQIGPFSESHRVIAPDLFWFGGSQPNNAMDSAAAQAEALSELLRHLHLDKAIIVGVSFGGFVAIRWALDHPEQIERLVLVDAAGLAPTSEEVARIGQTFGKQKIVDLLIPKSVSDLQNFMSKIFFRPRFVPDFVAKQILEQELWHNREAKERICARMEGGDFVLPSALRLITARTLLIWGRDDPLIVSSMAERMLRAIPGAKLVFMNESKHSPMLEQPKRFNRELASFITGP